MSCKNFFLMNEHTEGCPSFTSPPRKDSTEKREDKSKPSISDCPNCNTCIKDLRLENKRLIEKLANAEHDNEIYKWKIEELCAGKNKV